MSTKYTTIPSRYSDAQAIAAVEAETSLELVGRLFQTRQTPEIRWIESDGVANQKILDGYLSSGTVILEWLNDNLTLRARIYTISAGGVLTFTSIPILPATDPTLDNEAARKAYVDSLVTMQASDVLIAAAPTQRSVASATFGKVKEITIERPGEYRIAFDLSISNVAETALAEVRRNGVLVGVQQSEPGATPVNKSQDIAGWSVGDACELWLASGGVQSSRGENFEVHGSASFTVVTD